MISRKDIEILNIRVITWECLFFFLLISKSMNEILMFQIKFKKSPSIIDNLFFSYHTKKNNKHEIKFIDYFILFLVIDCISVYSLIHTLCWRKNQKKKRNGIVLLPSSWVFFFFLFFSFFYNNGRMVVYNINMSWDRTCCVSTTSSSGGSAPSSTFSSSFLTRGYDVSPLLLPFSSSSSSSSSFFSRFFFSLSLLTLLTINLQEKENEKKAFGCRCFTTTITRSPHLYSPFVSRVPMCQTHACILVTILHK